MKRARWRSRLRPRSTPDVGMGRCTGFQSASRISMTRPAAEQLRRSSLSRIGFRRRMRQASQNSGRPVRLSSAKPTCTGPGWGRQGSRALSAPRRHLVAVASRDYDAKRHRHGCCSQRSGRAGIRDTPIRRFARNSGGSRNDRRSSIQRRRRHRVADNPDDCARCEGRRRQ